MRISALFPSRSAALALSLLLTAGTLGACSDAPTEFEDAGRSERALEAARLLTRTLGVAFSGTMAAQEAAAGERGGPGGKTAAGDTLAVGCPTVVFETNVTSLGLALIFGDDGCTADDGTFYAGRITAFFVADGLRLRFDDFRSDEGAIDGTLRLTFDVEVREEMGGLFIGLPLAFRLEAEALTITTGHGAGAETVTLDADLTFTVPEASGGEARTVLVTGSGEVTTREEGEERSVAFEIDDALGFTPGCEYPTSGTMHLTLTDEAGRAFDALVDFGPGGGCDDVFEVTVDGHRQRGAAAA